MTTQDAPSKSEYAKALTHNAAKSARIGATAFLARLQEEGAGPAQIDHGEKVLAAATALWNLVQCEGG